MSQVRSRPLRRTRGLSCRASAFIAAMTATLGLTLPVFAQDEAVPSQQQSPQGATQVAAGKADFVKHCVPCHGNDAKGHGPEVNLIPGIKPADLTKMSKKNGGVFPFQDVEDTIDGRKKIPSHERFDMPFWGVNFQESGKEFSGESEAKSKARIDAIMAYIETIQEK
jgi:mono/diheme cytochrome c family protein